MNDGATARTAALARVLAGVGLALLSFGFLHAGDDGCPAIEGLDAVLGKGRVLLLGELHGTAESPAFVSGVTCHAFERKLHVTVALELPQVEEDVVVTFLDSAGSDEDVAKVAGLPFWAQQHQEGRTSRAMLKLLQDLRRMRKGGAKVNVMLLDKPEQFRQRDEAMADRLLGAVRESQDGFFVALTGNVHNRTAPGSGRMGERVEKALGSERVISLDVSHTGGTAWICEATMGCGPLGLRGHGEGSALRVTLLKERDPRGYHGTYHVGSITASPPARVE